MRTNRLNTAHQYFYLHPWTGGMRDHWPLHGSSHVSHNVYAQRNISMIKVNNFLWWYLSLIPKQQLNDTTHPAWKTHIHMMFYTALSALVLQAVDVFHDLCHRTQGVCVCHFRRRQPDLEDNSESMGPEEAAREITKQIRLDCKCDGTDSAGRRMSMWQVQISHLWVDNMW